jgi:hypothetical protein
MLVFPMPPIELMSDNRQVRARLGAMKSLEEERNADRARRQRTEKMLDDAHKRKLLVMGAESEVPDRHPQNPKTP